MKGPPNTDGSKPFEAMITRAGSEPSVLPRGTYARDPFHAPSAQGYPETCDFANFANTMLVDDTVPDGTRKQLYPATRHGGVEACVEDSSSHAGYDRTFEDTKSWKCRVAPNMSSAAASSPSTMTTPPSSVVTAEGIGLTQYRYVQYHPVLKSLSRSSLPIQPSVGTTLKGVPYLDHLKQIQAKEE